MESWPQMQLGVIHRSVSPMHFLRAAWLCASGDRTPQQRSLLGASWRPEQFARLFPVIALWSEEFRHPCVDRALANAGTEPKTQPQAGHFGSREKRLPHRVQSDDVDVPIDSSIFFVTKPLPSSSSRSPSPSLSPSPSPSSPSPLQLSHCSLGAMCSHNSIRKYRQ